MAASQRLGDPIGQHRFPLQHSCGSVPLLCQLVQFNSCEVQVEKLSPTKRQRLSFRAGEA